MLTGAPPGSSISSGGSAGMSSQDQIPNSASQMCVNTRARSTPPEARMNSRARTMCSASGESPHSRSAA